MRNYRREANPIWRYLLYGAIGMTVAVLVAWGAMEIVKADHRWQERCRNVYHGAVQTQTWSGYGFHTDVATGKMVYGYYSTSTTVCRLVSGPNAGAIVDTE